MFKLLPFLVAGALSQQVLEEVKHCDPGFLMVGKQCVQTLTRPLNFACPPGTTALDDHQCVIFSAKLPECEAGYTFADGLCSKTVAVAPVLSCPTAGSVLVDETTCMKQVALPDSYACPAGARVKGDTCFAMTTYEPDLFCPSGFLQGNLCVTEETYDCTPAVGEAGPIDTGCNAAPGPLGATQSALLRAKAKFAATGKEHAPGDADACDVCAGAIGGVCPGRLTGPWANGVATSRPQFVEETLVSARCKRIAVEPALRTCATGRLDGKVCVVETPVDAIAVSGGFATETVQAVASCPPGYAVAEGLTLTPWHCASGALECLRTETIPACYNCAAGTRDLGDRCGILSEPRPFCEEGYHMANGECTRTIIAEPITEYTVRYTCTGKDCATV